MDSGFPEYTDSFLQGQDIFYSQFNEIEFYVEDINQEHFYFNVLKRIFSDLQFDKIFPLNGKKNVCDAAKLSIGNKKKVYIVDLDFDSILGSKEDVANLFYLKKYSIENYLFSQSAIYEAIRSKNPKLKNHEIDNLLDFNSLLLETSNCLKLLACCFIIIQNKELGIPYYGLNTSRDFDFSKTPTAFKLNFIRSYFDLVEVELKKKDRRFSLERQISVLLKHFKTLADCLANIPGKYILIFLKDRLQLMGLIGQVTLETFVYNLSKDFASNELDFLKEDIENYLIS